MEPNHNEEVQNLLKNGVVHEVKYSDQLVNVVVGKKKSGKWQVCIDYSDLNKSCPKDLFPLPHIDTTVDATADHEILSFMDLFVGYNQIKIDPADQEKMPSKPNETPIATTSFPFGLKNAGTTYQYLVNRMFANQIRKMMEVYVDDILLKLWKLNITSHIWGRPSKF